jgi:hypothetical protein
VEDIVNNLMRGTRKVLQSPVLASMLFVGALISLWATSDRRKD